MQILSKKEQSMAMWILEKIDLKSNKLQETKKNIVSIRVLIQQEDLSVINIYATNDKPSKYIKWILTELKGKIDTSVIIVWNFYTPFTIIGGKT